MTFPARPAPRNGLYEDAFWSHVQDDHVCIQLCASCSKFWYPPGPVCPRCQSEAWTWDRVTGRGRAIAWTTFHRAYFKEFPVPHTVVCAALTEGPLLIADFGSDPVRLRIDSPLKLEFIDIQFRDVPARTFRWMPAS